MTFIILVAFSALFVAGCAAFFSIKGLIVLFSGSSLAVGIMASSLEIGKLVAASFLHTYWKSVNFLLKTYLCLAVLVLMCITSLGIFGFLTNAYQVHSAKVDTFDTRIAALLNEKTVIEQTIQEYSSRIKTLTEVRVTQEQRIQTAGNYKAPRDQAYKAIAEANEEIQKKENELAQERQKSVAIEKELTDLKITLNTTTDIGSFKFIADAMHTTVDEAVRYFIFSLICVFDPLAVALVLAWNNLNVRRAESKKEEHLEYMASLTQSMPLPVVVDEKLQPTRPLPPQSAAIIENIVVEPAVEGTTPEPETVSESEITVSDTEPQPAPEEPAAPEAVQEQQAAKLVEEEKQRVERERIRRLQGNNDSVLTI